MKDQIIDHIGRQVRKVRKAKGITQITLADELKVAQSKISRIERGVFSPTIKDLEAIAEALEVSVVDLMRQKAA
jgi:transcriptional regulator with XRE-family HTH domain